MPHELDPASLATVGQASLGGFSTLGAEGRTPPVDIGAGDAVNDAIGFGGMAFTAHPHVDPRRVVVDDDRARAPREDDVEDGGAGGGGSRLVGWGWTNLAREDSMRVRLREWDAAWRVRAEAEFVMAGAALAPHDFALTPDYYVFIEVMNAVSQRSCTRVIRMECNTMHRNEVV